MKSKYYFFLLILTSICLFSECRQNAGKKENSDSRVNTPGDNSLALPAIDIYKAAMDGDLASVTAALTNGQKANAVDQEGRSALLYASYNGHTDIMKLLLENGAEVNLKDNFGRTALMMASSGPYPAAVTLLLDKFADPNITDRDDHFSAIMYAASEGQTEVVKILLARGADPTFKDKDGDTAESFAEKNGHKDVVALLKNFRK